MIIKKTVSYLKQNSKTKYLLKIKTAKWQNGKIFSNCIDRVVHQTKKIKSKKEIYKKINKYCE